MHVRRGLGARLWGWRRLFWCRRRRLRCISCATTSRMGRLRASSCSARGTRICIRWCRGLSGWSRWRLAGSCGRWGARWRGNGRLLGSRFRFWGCGLCVLGRWSRSSRRRSFWRVCSRPGIRRGWRGFLALVAGGRFPPRVVLVLSWRRCFTAPGGSWMRSCSAMRVRGGRRWFASRRRPGLHARWLRGWRRWPRDGRAAVLPGS